MSRRKKRNRQRAAANHQNNQNKVRTYTVSLDEWKHFQRFKHKISTIEKSLSELQEGWDTMVEWMRVELKYTEEEFGHLRENITEISDLFTGIRYHRAGDTQSYDTHNPVHVVTKKNKVGKNKFWPRIAEIVIEDVSDDKI